MSCCCDRQGFGARQRGTMCTVWRKLLESSSFLHTVHIVPRCLAPNPCLPQQQDIIPYVVKNLSLALLKMGKSLPETWWADHWRSIKLLLLHLVGFYFTLHTMLNSYAIWKLCAKSMRKISLLWATWPGRSRAPTLIILRPSPGNFILDRRRLTQRNLHWTAHAFPVIFQRSYKRASGFSQNVVGITCVLSSVS